MDVTGSTELPLTAASKKSPGLRLSPEGESLPGVTLIPNMGEISALPLIGLCAVLSILHSGQAGSVASFAHVGG